MVTKKKLVLAKDEKIVRGIALIVTLVMSLACLIPFLRVVAQAFSADVYVQSGDITVYPKGFTLKHINFIISSSQFRSGLWISFSSTIVFTVVSMILTTLTAYPLSRMYLKGRKQFTFFIAFTMLFNGGIIPTYLVVKQLGLMDTFAALIVPIMISAYNVVILITAFRNTPIAFEEAARVDGASHFKILVKIMIPLNKPTLAVLLLFYAVSRWNGWFDAMMYTRSPELQTLQLVVKNVIASGTKAITKIALTNPSPTTAVQSAAVVFSILPILVLYPFLQKYFVKGVMIGGIKG